MVHQDILAVILARKANEYRLMFDQHRDHLRHIQNGWLGPDAAWLAGFTAETFPSDVDGAIRGYASCIMETVPNLDDVSDTRCH